MKPLSLLVPSAVALICFQADYISATYRYFGSYLAYGTGDTIVQTFHYHGGPRGPHRKWNVECQDGEAMVGAHDLQDDFERIQVLWCKFMFPYKPPTGGRYPYYSDCFNRNYSTNFFCYDPRNSTLSMNSFVTGIWDDDAQFFYWRGSADLFSTMKCCRAPKGYYIDYTSCYFMPTHDQFGEYYDSNFHIIVACASGFLVTGMAYKRNAVTALMTLDWIQCCRLGYGGPQVLPPPVITYGKGGYPSYVAQGPASRTQIPAGYQSQYRSLGDSTTLSGNFTKALFTEERHGTTWSKHYQKHDSNRVRRESVSSTESCAS